MKTAFTSAVKRAELSGKGTPHTVRHTVHKWKAASFLGMRVETLDRTTEGHRASHRFAARGAANRWRSGAQCETLLIEIRSVFALAPLKLRRTLLRPNGLRVAAPRVARKGEAWWARRDSNPQPDRYERPALTVELQALKRVARLIPEPAYPATATSTRTVIIEPAASAR